MGWPGGEVDFAYWATRLLALLGLGEDINLLGVKARLNLTKAQQATLLVMQYDAEQRAVDLHASAAVVIDEAEFAKPIKKEADAGASGADHFGQSLLADLGDHRDGSRFLSEIGHQQQESGQAFFARIE